MDEQLVLVIIDFIKKVVMSPWSLLWIIPAGFLFYKCGYKKEEKK